MTGLEIQNRNECLTAPCQANATCNNTVGSYICACDSGYNGDGFNCSGMFNFVRFPEMRILKKTQTKHNKLHSITSSHAFCVFFLSSCTI